MRSHHHIIRGKRMSTSTSGTSSTRTSATDWQPTACMLCSLGCGLEMQVDGSTLKKIRGDKQSPSTQGYICQKAAKLNHYQNHTMRLDKPLRRKPDGSFEAISWDQAINDIATKMKQLKREHGGETFAYFGGGGQGNHLGGTYAGALRQALGTPYLYNALAQEKTGDFWVNGKLFGRQSCFVVEGMAHADYCLVLGSNPWSSHGVPRTRDILKQYQKDPNKTLVVIDPRQTQSAKMADIHLQLKPGTDAFLLSAMIAVILEHDLHDKAFIAEHTEGFDKVQASFTGIPVTQYAEICGIEEAQLRRVACDFARAERATVRADLGIQQSLNSTLNSYLEKLLFLITGNFNREGGNHLIAQFAPIIGHSLTPDQGAPRTQVTGMMGISKMFPPNILPQEINTDHPKRIRALIVDSSNPALSAADYQAYVDAFEKLELMVVIDVAMTETARHADYILPAPTQYEKLESAFFTFGFPTNYFHLRKPIIANPTGDTLPEPEIYRRLVVALGEIPDHFPVLENIARADRSFQFTRLFPVALAASLKANPGWMKYLPLILYSTLGKALPEGMASAASLWGVCQLYASKYPKQVQRTGLTGSGYPLGNALFNRFIASDRAAPLSQFNFQDTWDLVKHPQQKVHLHIDEMAQALETLNAAQSSDEYPFTLMAGERRSYNANQIFRTPDWRKQDRDGAMRIHPDDLVSLGLKDGETAICRSARAEISVLLKEDEAMLPGSVSLPHGFGMTYLDQESNEEKVNGPIVNLLTQSDYCDPLAKTPYHKCVPVALVSAN